MRSRDAVDRPFAPGPITQARYCARVQSRVAVAINWSNATGLENFARVTGREAGRLGQRREHDDRQPVRRRIAAVSHRLEKGRAVHHRHHHVEQHEARRTESRDRLERLEAVLGGRHDEALHLEQLLDRLMLGAPSTSVAFFRRPGRRRLPPRGDDPTASRPSFFVGRSRE